MYIMIAVLLTLVGLAKAAEFVRAKLQKMFTQ